MPPPNALLQAPCSFWGSHRVPPLLFLRSHFYHPASWLANEKCQAFSPAFSPPFWKFLDFLPLVGICIFIKREVDAGVIFPLYLAYCGSFKSETRSLVFNLREIILPSLLELVWTKKSLLVNFNSTRPGTHMSLSALTMRMNSVNLHIVLCFLFLFPLSFSQS